VDDFAKAPVVTNRGIARVHEGRRGGMEKIPGRGNKSLPGFIQRFQSLSAFARFSVVNEYFVNSEGTVTRTGRNAYSVQLSASTQAPDGMRLARSPAWTVAKYEELPTGEKLVQYTREALETLKALRTRRLWMKSIADRCCSKRMQRMTWLPTHRK